jgi:peptidyl-tRNA hydrolase, PTH1 family
MLWLIVGLGNPGSRYESSRHNVGFMALDALRSAWGLPDYKEKFSGVFTRGEALGHTVVLLKPMTFMNLSGGSVQPAMAFLKAELSGVLVLHDELDLAFGDVRLKVGGGHAGHNGLRSIIERASSPDFVRVRIGIGRPPAEFRGDVADYVLSGFDSVERAELPGIVTRAGDTVRKVLSVGTAAAMNQVNTQARKPAAPKPPRPAAAPVVAPAAPSLALTDKSADKPDSK